MFVVITMYCFFFYSCWFYRSHNDYFELWFNYYPQGPPKKKTYWSHGHVDVVSRLTWLFCMKYSLDYFGQRAVTKYHGFIFALVGICRSKSDGEYQFHIIFQQHLSAFADGRLMRFFIGHLSAIKFCKTFADGGLMRFFIGHLSVITIVRNHK